MSEESTKNNPKFTMTFSLKLFFKYRKPGPKGAEAVSLKVLIGRDFDL